MDMKVTHVHTKELRNSYSSSARLLWE